MIIDRYVRREIVGPFLLVSAILLSIFLTYALTRFLLDANAGLLLASEVVQLTLLKLLISLEVLLPLSLYIAVLAGLGRLYSDSEIYAMRSGGISEMRLLRPVMVLALVLALMIGMFSVFVRPWAYAQSYEIKARAESTSEAERIKGARFYSFQESGRTVFVRTFVNGGEALSGVFIRTRKGDDLEIITSASGKLSSQDNGQFHQLVLDDASVYKRVNDGPDFFAELGSFSLLLPVSEPDPVGYKTKSTSTDELRWSGNTDDIAEFQWRLSTPLSALLLALLAIPLSRSRPRQGVYAKLLVALVLYAVYFNLLDVSRTWVELGSSSTIWWVPQLLSAVVILLFIPWRKIHQKILRRRSEAVS